ncbi:hypothetical protein [Dietzia cinnamea]|uniref:hypothetical protein n=1 Tax=Dietzia cinnamea TaxID=321318 RepID=UPI004055D08E
MRGGEPDRLPGGLTPPVIAEVCDPESCQVTWRRRRLPSCGSAVFVDHTTRSEV